MMIPRSGETAIKLAPSILSADVARLAEQVGEAEQGGADRIHVDVMDGHFVPNLTFGPVIVKWLRPVTQLPLEVHLMIDNPDQFLEAFAEAGAEYVHRSPGRGDPPEPDRAADQGAGPAPGLPSTRQHPP